ncbi:MULTISPECIES: hypothetical protein [Burkholderia]|uniref:hypothetical protein n=1 Tax=Burkholderia TaxID=32008 RepID=UPI001269A435|nr:MULTISPECIES: hypothetical protein [Burkholderia]
MDLDQMRRAGISRDMRISRFNRFDQVPDKFDSIRRVEALRCIAAHSAGERAASRTARAWHCVEWRAAGERSAVRAMQCGRAPRNRRTSRRGAIARK